MLVCSSGSRLDLVNTITFRLPAPNAKKVRVYTDMPKLGDTPVNGSAGFDLTKDANGVWSFTTPKLAPSYYQYWFEVDGLTTPDPQNTFVRPASGVYKSVAALPGKEADFMMFRDVPHGNLIEHQYLNQLTKVARRVTPPDYGTSHKKYPVVSTRTCCSTSPSTPASPAMRVTRAMTSPSVIRPARARSLPEGAPYDGTVECADGLHAEDGFCRADARGSRFINE